MIYTYALCPFVADRDGVFRGPTDEYAAIDLRAAEEGASAGLGFFRIPGSPRLNSDCYIFGRGKSMTDIKLTPRVSERLGRGIQGDTLSQAILSKLTDVSDPEGSGSVRSLMPDCWGRLQITVGGECLLNRRMRFDDTHYDKVRSVLRADIKALAESGDGKVHRKYLDDARIKLGLTDGQVRQLWPDDAPLPRETTYSDNFNRANESLPASGWSVPNGSAAVVSNQLVLTGVNPNYQWPAVRYDSDLSSSDQTSTVTQTAQSNGAAACGPALRFASAAQTFYAAYWAQSGYVAGIYKSTAGTETILATNSSHALLSLPITLTFTANGSALDLSEAVEGALNSTTDTSITGNVRCGIGGTSSFNQTSTMDNWSCADLGGTPIVDNTNPILRSIQC